MRGWLRPPFSDGDFSTSLGVLRSHAYFLRLLTPVEIDEFALHCRTNLDRLLAECEATQAKYREAGDPFSEWAMGSAVLETRARIQWIEELRDRFGGRPELPR